MKQGLLVIIGVASILLHCSTGGSFGDFAGGGVIGNPNSPSLSYTDTLSNKVVTVNNFDLNADPGMIPVSKPSGPDQALVNTVQKYSFSGYRGDKRFRFSSGNEEQLSSWISDTIVSWTFTSAGVCSVQVQGAKDTAKWSLPLVVHAYDIDLK